MTNRMELCSGMKIRYIENSENTTHFLMKISNMYMMTWDENPNNEMLFSDENSKDPNYLRISTLMRYLF